MVYRWDNIIKDNLREYPELKKVAFSCPMALAVGTFLPLATRMYGPDFSVEAVNYSMPLIAFSVIVCPQRGRSSALKHFVYDAAKQVFADHVINVLLETSFAGLHRPHIANKNYALMSCDERHRKLSNISLKETCSETERSLLNKLLTGKGDKISLRDGECHSQWPHSFNHSHFWMN